MTLFLLAVAVAGWGFAWVEVLPSDGHVLAPVRLRWRLWYRARYDSELDQARWWKPVWGCAACHSAWLALLAYPIRFHATYDPLLHLLVVGVTITTAFLLSKWSQL